MDKAIRIWRVFSWISGGVCGVPSAVLLWINLSEWFMPRQNASIAFATLWILASILGSVAAFAMKRGTRWAVPIAWIAASVQTLAVPVFTPLGVFGLFLLCARAGEIGARQERQPSQTVVPAILAFLVEH